MKTGRPITIILSVLISSLLLVANISFAQSVLTIFGPKQYDKPKGKPVTYIDTFQSNFTAGTYTLWVQSGAEGLNEIKNVSVSLNGIEIIDSRDLRAANPVSKIISIQSINTLAVTLKGQGGNYITAKILCDGCYPTTIGTISPAGGALTLEGYASVIFPAGAFSSNQAVKVSATSFPETENDYKNDTPGGARLPYEIRINFGLIIPSTPVDAVLYIPDTFLNSLSQGSAAIEVFADMTYSTQNELLGGFEGIPFTYEPTTKSVRATLSKEAFSNLSTLDSTYEAIVIIGTISK